MAWMMARGEAVWCCGNPGVRGWCCGGNEHTFKVDIGLGYVQNDDHVFFFKARAVTPLKTNMTMENAQLEDGFPIEKWEFFFVMLVFRNVYMQAVVASEELKTISRSFPGEG